MVGPSSPQAYTLEGAGRKLEPVAGVGVHGVFHGVITGRVVVAVFEEVDIVSELCEPHQVLQVAPDHPAERATHEVSQDHNAQPPIRIGRFGAFAGAGLSEIFYRRKLPVLSRPLERTALLLPILPAVGFWLFAPGDMHWELWGRTPMVWFLIGGFYAAVAYMRRSWVCGVLAVLTANMGLWVALTLGDFRCHACR